MIDPFVIFHVLPGETEEFERVHRQLLELISSQPGFSNRRISPEGK